ncbi:hypothetical protein DM791_09160 [Paenarthrobacter nitroguajacolicus]|nr:hypothetical protein [Paenarthrobacter nitroguajacolicus]
MREHHQSVRACLWKLASSRPRPPLARSQPVADLGARTGEVLGRSRYARRFRLPHPLQHATAGAI